ncbi:FliI/YscN family ATPase [Ochrobactrum sp. Marseille-Q0166]|uniref:FliI/YscN family ATPase n=1 Tax=Ochrobactrum sp. Marseille-Q0166 TaxID=2761105 RepID=UPI001655E3A9|nr:FliI/YscN family ATPase [Ochrobactrum sp. Marseille-Q0166]MBC8719594.1 FliI/YscN family ATPase [Ochrobactrum sp. Marseille-Q0166]
MTDNFSIETTVDSGQCNINIPLRSKGRVSSCTGVLVKAAGSFSIGQVCRISRSSRESILAEVVGFDGGQALLSPYDRVIGVSHNSTIEPVSQAFDVAVGTALTGRVIDAFGNVIDGRSPLQLVQRYPCYQAPPHPLLRPAITRPFPLGVRALDGVLTCGEGQRMGIFAAAGGGKSTLVSLLVRNALYDRCVIALIGERGREVREFVETQLGIQGLAKSVVIVATSDRPAMEQIKAAYTATAIAEYFRDRGEKVLLIMDSLTRFARAQRQIGLAAGEPPARRGFPPSIFEQLPILLERAGTSQVGSITAFYTVLVEGDDMDEPIADEVRSLLDGHIILSRKLASTGHYPAIDIVASASRLVTQILPKPHVLAINALRGLLAKYDAIELLIRIGEYESGHDRVADEAIERKPEIDNFLRQSNAEYDNFEDTATRLMQVVGRG